MKECVVIGSGCSGLTCAIIMAKHGYNVTVVEKSPDIAPVLQGFTRKKRYFDTGVHCLSGLEQGEPLRTLLNYLNISTDMYQSFPKDNSFTIHLTDGRIWNAPQGQEDFTQSLVDLFPHEESGIRSFLSDVYTTSSLFQYTNNFQNIEEHNAAHTTLQETMDASFADIHLQTCISILNNLFCGVTNSESSFAFFASCIGTYFRSCGNFIGGGKTLLAEIIAQTERLGIQIRTNNGVATIETDGKKKATGVTLEDGTHYSADLIISTCNPSLLPTLLPEGSLRKIRVAYYKELEQTTSFISIFGYTPHPVPALYNTNHVIAPRATDGTHSKSTSNGASSGTSLACNIEDRQMLVTNATDANNNHQISIIIPDHYEDWVHFAGKKPHQRIKGYVEYKREMADKALRKVMQIIPELHDNFTTLAISSPLTMKDFCNMPQGACYGVKQTMQQLKPTATLPIKNLLLSGQATVAPGILGTMTAAFITCGQILGHELLQEEVKKCN